MVEIKNGVTSDLEAKRKQLAFREMLKTEGWKFFAEFLTGKMNEKINTLITCASKEDDIRAVNQLGRDIEFCKYILDEPQFEIDLIEVHFKRKEK